MVVWGVGGCVCECWWVCLGVGGCVGVLVGVSGC